MTRAVWIRAHQRKLPVRPDAFATVHLELLDAYRRDQLQRELEQWISAELEREFRQEVA